MSSLRWPSVLFDLDGTLGNSIPLIIASYRWTLEHYDLAPADEATIRSWIGRTLDDMFTELDGPERVDELIAAYSGWQQENAADHMQPYPGVRELLVDLRDAGATLGVATSRRRESAENLLRIVGLDDLVRVDVAMEDTTEHKPAAAPLLLAAERVGADPAETVYVGDAIVDLGAADAAGMAGIGVTWGAGQPGALRDFPSVAVVDTVDDLRALLIEGERDAGFLG